MTNKKMFEEVVKCVVCKKKNIAFNYSYMCKKCYKKNNKKK
jgi:hypothetical protein